MCDYSLHAHPNRLATEGEELLTYRFSGHTIGLAQPLEVKPVTPVCTEVTPTRWWSWAAFKRWMSPPRQETHVVPAVCVPPGARLILNDIPEDLQRELGVSATECVTFVQTTASEYVHRDGVRFSNGRVILLQRLRTGQRVQVLTLALAEEPAERAVRPLRHPVAQ
jgi:hypothetical protein